MDEQDRYCLYCEAVTDRADGFCCDEHRGLWRGTMIEEIQDQGLCDYCMVKPAVWQGYCSERCTEAAVIESQEIAEAQVHDSEEAAYDRYIAMLPEHAHPDY